MPNKKIRWSKVYESSEEELVEFLRSRDLQAQRITAEASSEDIHQSSEQEFMLWCAEGSLVLTQDSTATSLQPGDAVRIHATSPYELRPGISGYVCYVTK